MNAGRTDGRRATPGVLVSTEKFLVYFLLIAFYAIYSRFSDAPDSHRVDPNPAVASIPAPAQTARAGSPQR